MTRKRQYWALLILTALTLASTYWLQGFMIHGEPAGVPDDLWTIESWLWSLRALIEAWALAYVGSTITKTVGQSFLKWSFEFILIGLIAYTVGTMFAAIGQNQSVWQVYGDAGPWAFALAAYAPLMMISVSICYSIMPYDVDNQSEIEKRLQSATETNSDLAKQLKERDAELKAIEQAAIASANQVQEAERQMKSMQSELQQVQQTADDLATRLKSSDDRLNDYEHRIDQTENSNGELQAENSRLKSELRALKSQQLPDDKLKLFSDDPATRMKAMKSVWPTIPNNVIAEIENVSPATVSRRLNGNGDKNGKA